MAVPLVGGVVLYECAIIPFFAPPCPVTAQPQLIVISHLGTKNEAVAPGSGAFVGGREDNGPTASQIVSDLCTHTNMSQINCNDHENILFSQTSQPYNIIAVFPPLLTKLL